MSLNLVSLSNP